MKYFRLLETNELIIKLKRFFILSSVNQKDILASVANTKSFYFGLSFYDFSDKEERKEKRIDFKSFIPVLTTSKLVKVTLNIVSSNVSQSSIDIKKLLKFILLYTKAEIKLAEIAIPIFFLQVYCDANEQRIIFVNIRLPLNFLYLVLKRCGGCISIILRLRTFKSTLKWIKRSFSEIIRCSHLEAMDYFNFTNLLQRLEKIMGKDSDNYKLTESFFKTRIRPLVSRPNPGYQMYSSYTSFRAAM